MDKFTCIQQIYITHPDIEPGFINLMWGRLEQQNPDFFRAYNHRLYLKRQIHLFNSLVGFQARLMQQQGCKFISSSSTSTSSHIQQSHFPTSANQNATPTSATSQGIPLAQTNPLNHAMSPSSSSNGSSFSNTFNQFAQRNGTGTATGTPNMMPQQQGMMGRAPGATPNYNSPNFMNPLAFAQTHNAMSPANQAKLFNAQQQNAANQNNLQGSMFINPMGQNSAQGAPPIGAQNQHLLNALQMSQNGPQSGFPSSMSPSLITNALMNNMRLNQQKLNQQLGSSETSSNNATPTGDASSPVPSSTTSVQGGNQKGADDSGQSDKMPSKNLGLNINTGNQQNQNDSNRGGFPTPATSTGANATGAPNAGFNPMMSNFYNPAFMNPNALQMAGQNGFNANSALIQHYANLAAANQQQQQQQANSTTPSSGTPFSFQNAMQNPGTRQNPLFDQAQFRNMMEQNKGSNQFSLTGEDSNSSLGSNGNFGVDSKKQKGAEPSSMGNMFNNMNAFNRPMGAPGQMGGNMPQNGLSNPMQFQYLQQLLKQQQMAQQQMANSPQSAFSFPNMQQNTSSTAGSTGSQNDLMHYGQQQNGKGPKISSSRKRKSPTEKTSRPSKRRKDSSNQDRRDKMKSLMEQYKSPEQQRVFKHALKDAPNIDMEQLERRLIVSGKQRPDDTSPSQHFHEPSSSKSRSNSEFPVPKPTTQSTSSSLNFHPLEDEDHSDTYDPNNLWGDRPTHTEPADIFDSSNDMLTFNTEEEDPCDSGLFNEYFN